MIREPAVYFARTIATASGRQADYIDFLRRTMIPLWEGLHSQGVLERIDTIKLGRALHADEGLPEWDLVQVGRVADGALGKDFFGHENDLKGKLAGNAADLEQELASIMRTESLRTTPNSHLPLPTASVAARRPEVRLSIEVIRVTPTEEALSEYQRLMILNAGPASRRLRDAGFTYNFVPLETDEVLFEADGMPGWNQLHVIGMLPENMESHVATYDRALRDVNPESGGFEGYFGVLDSIRHRPRWSFGRWLDDLAVGGE